MVKLSLTSAVLAMSSVAAADWSIVNWEAGCVRQGCFYDFNVTAPANGDIPSFAARCTGDEDRTNVTYFKPCGVYDSGLGNRGVGAKFVPRVDQDYDPIKQIAVTFQYTNITSGA